MSLCCVTNESQTKLGFCAVSLLSSVKKENKLLSNNLYQILQILFQEKDKIIVLITRTQQRKLFILIIVFIFLLAESMNW